MTESEVFWTAYFRERPAYSRILQELRQKYRRYGHPAGTVRLEDASEEECRALRNIFGEPFSPPVRFRAERFEAAMRQLKFPEVCLKEVLELYFDEKLVTNRERRQARDSRFCQMLRAAAEEAESEACHQWLQGLEEKQGGGALLLYREAERDLDGAREALDRACRSLAWLEQNAGRQGRLAVLSAQAAGDPHALDSSALGGKLFLHLPAARGGQAVPENAEQRDALYFRCGILCDSISSTVTQVGLVLMLGNTEHPAYGALRGSHEICTLTLATLSRLTGAHSPSGRAYLVENEMVFSQLCDQAGRFHSPLVCTSGQPSVAALRLLDLLAESGTELYYAGDFDGKGLSIAVQLLSRYPEQLKPWRMTPEDYAVCVCDTPLSDASAALLRGCAGTALEETARAIARAQRAGYQEFLLGQLEADLTETP